MRTQHTFAGVGSSIWCWAKSRRQCRFAQSSPRSIMRKDKRQKRDVHALDEDGMVVCNPRDKEAAHRAAMGDIATAEPAEVTCRKCLALLFKLDNPRPEGSDNA